MRRDIHETAALVFCGAAALGIVATAGCSWQRFEDLRTDAPVENVEPPASIEEGFGSTLASLATDSEAELFAGAPPLSQGAAMYRLGRVEEPELQSFDGGHCRGGGDTPCFLSAHPVGLPRAMTQSGTVQQRCFVSGVGRIGNRDFEIGLWGRCRDSLNYALPVPSDIESDYIQPLMDGEDLLPVYFGVTREETPTLVVGIEELGRAFFYARESTDPIDLVPPAAPGNGYGATVGAARLATGDYLYAVAAPRDAEVWLFRGVEAVGCISGPDRFGRALATGDVNGDGVDDLVLADDSRVTTYDGAALGELSATSASSCADAEPEGIRLAVLDCGSSADTGECASSDFGASLTVGDFDGDGRGEVAVGAPTMSVFEKNRAGAVLIYDADGDLSDTRYVSTASNDDLFGTALATVEQDGRDVLAVGAPGAGEASVVYCATVVGSGVSPRCP